MKRWTLITAASLFAFAAAAQAWAFDEAQYQAVKSGQGDCPWCDLSGADLATVKFAGADLSGADLTEADLSGADLTKADLSGADLTGAVLTGADLSGADFTAADLDQVDLSGAVLVGAKLERANCDWATKLPQDSGLSCVGVTIERE
ncbi:MAG: pentapeptide repeat-containing protein [Paracoccaceae bacterium]|nr:pentapeptide repeat-containing protein [Paracoccaceae bacterium]